MGFSSLCQCHPDGPYCNIKFYSYIKDRGRGLIKVEDLKDDAHRNFILPVLCGMT